ncbi:hypothetical protein L873DRAFT_498586 [Choiromyces venosus 120613-1]|uniref:Uncharacterized protein n=1 Tax=Choiromyces venosus 120613-1 TaxID=1336337 RepID=A0A3N4J0M4_9PEZI|nr:hypothetical protein L873DRAFT_498586 [Choiromyces venosus 120613-1]
MIRFQQTNYPVIKNAKSDFSLHNTYMVQATRGAYYAAYAIPPREDRPTRNMTWGENNQTCRNASNCYSTTTENYGNKANNFSRAIFN